MIKIIDLQKTLSSKAFEIVILLASKKQKEIQVPELLFKFKLKHKDWELISRELRKHRVIKYEPKQRRLIFLQAES